MVWPKPSPLRPSGAAGFAGSATAARTTGSGVGGASIIRYPTTPPAAVRQRTPATAASRAVGGGVLEVVGAGPPGWNMSAPADVLSAADSPGWRAATSADHRASAAAASSKPVASTSPSGVRKRTHRLRGSSPSSAPRRVETSQSRATVTPKGSCWRNRARCLPMASSPFRGKIPGRSRVQRPEARGGSTAAIWARKSSSSVPGEGEVTCGPSHEAAGVVSPGSQRAADQGRSTNTGLVSA